MKPRASKVVKKNPNDYPRVTLRVPGDLLARVNALKDRSDLSQAQIFTHCVRRHLPDLEKFHTSKP